MDEVENQGVMQQEIAPPETSQQDSVESQPPVDDRQERNWREMRRQKEELVRKTKMQEELIAQLLTVKQQTQQQPVAPEVDELDNVPDDDYIQKGQVKKLVRKAEERAALVAKQETEKFFHQREQSQFMDKLKRQFSDFDEIVNPETLSLLEENDPDLANTIAELKDPYKIGLQSYKYIKALGIAEKAPSARRVKEVEKKIEQNSKTVQTPQAFEKRPMAQAFQMTEADKKKLYSEMMHYANMGGGGY
jgi:DNA-directed RNA polymerase subunit F